jgi:hypothetical protein
VDKGKIFIYLAQSWLARDKSGEQLLASSMVEPDSEYSPDGSRRKRTTPCTGEHKPYMKAF